MLDTVNLEAVKTTAGDLNLGQLEAEIAKNAAAIAKLSAEEMGDRPTIIYTPGIASARAVADTLNELRTGSAVYVDADTDREERRAMAVASNAPFSEWKRTFTDPRLCAAIVDRLTYNAHIIETGTESFRLAQTRARAENG